jgi:hypothetical protein
MKFLLMPFFYPSPSGAGELGERGIFFQNEVGGEMSPEGFCPLNPWKTEASELLPVVLSPIHRRLVWNLYCKDLYRVYHLVIEHPQQKHPAEQFFPLRGEGWPLETPSAVLTLDPEQLSPPKNKDIPDDDWPPPIGLP